MFCEFPALHPVLCGWLLIAVVSGPCRTFCPWRWCRGLPEVLATVRGVIAAGCCRVRPVVEVHPPDILAWRYQRRFVMGHVLNPENHRPDMVLGQHCEKQREAMRMVLHKCDWRAGRLLRCHSLGNAGVGGRKAHDRYRQGDVP